MPNPFSPKPGSSWRNPSPRSGPPPAAPDKLEPRAGRAAYDEQLWRRTMPLEGDLWDEPSQPFTPHERAAMRAIAAILAVAALACAVIIAGPARWFS